MIMAKSWLWGSQIAVKKIKNKKKTVPLRAGPHEPVAFVIG